MLALKGIYHKGKIELIEKPGNLPSTEIMVIFPDEGKKAAKIGGVFKNSKIDFGQVNKDIMELNQKSEKNLLKDY